MKEERVKEAKPQINQYRSELLKSVFEVFPFSFPVGCC